MSIGAESFDVKQATEIGAALLLDKPLLLLVPKGRQIGVRLRRAADHVLEDFDPEDPTSQEKLRIAIDKIK